MARFTPNEGFFAALGKSPGVVSLTNAAAHATLSRARAAAPVVSGKYRDSIHLERADTAHRAVFRVVASARHSMAVEARTGNLARALRGGR